MKDLITIGEAGSEMTSRDDRFDWIPLKAYAAEKGKAVRTVRYWIRRGYVEARRDGEAPHSPWLVKVIRAAQKAS